MRAAIILAAVSALALASLLALIGDRPERAHATDWSRN